MPDNTMIMKGLTCGAYILAGCLLVLIIDLVYKLVNKKKKASIKTSFIKGVVQTIVNIFVVIRVASESETLSSFGNTILMSSSMLVVVLGFIFQEGLSNIVHGFILVWFKPFDIGYRVEISVGGEKLTGYVRSITLRHTIITNIIDNADCIIPNSILDKASVKNLTTSDITNKYPVKVTITYEDAQVPEKLQLAKDIFIQTVREHPLTVTRADKPIFVNVSLESSGVMLTCFVETRSAEDNYTACSDIKGTLLAAYAENGIEFAYDHMQLTGSVNIKQSEVGNR